MADNSVDSNFLEQITSLIEANMANEQFGVTELAEAMHMSRSNLLRKVKKSTNLSVSQLIREVRLKRGMYLLRNSQMNVSEISHELGFGSTSYFIKCFREYYGYPPGEANKQPVDEIITDPVPDTLATSPRRSGVILLAIGFIILAGGAYLIYRAMSSAKVVMLERSIAVLPFKNDSNDSTNIYLINGLMESTLNNLQKIEDLKVISRTSSEKYRNTTKSIPEMSEELSVNYFVEGSGQKVGDEILLNVQLIEGPTDRHLWAQQYRRKIKDIFQLQQEIARNIADEIQVIIKPEEEKQIAKIPTENLEAYDLFLRGNEQLFESSSGSLAEAIGLYKKAIEHDPKFALAYANMTIAFYYLDFFQQERKYGGEISEYSDKAMLYDPKLAESLIAKALFYMNRKEYTKATPYLEKALEYNPNHGMIFYFLSELYNIYIPNVSKYLQYALQGVRINAAAGDSAGISFRYMHLGNAFIQAGFIDESLKYTDKALAYNPENPFAKWIKTATLHARDRDLKRTMSAYLMEYEKDTSRFYMAQEIGKAAFYLDDDKMAYEYYMRFVRTTQLLHLDLYKASSLNIAIIADRLGKKKESEEYIKIFKDFAEHDQTIYKDLHWFGYYAWIKDKKRAFGHLREFSKKDDYQYWILLMPDDPSVRGLVNDPEFQEIFSKIESHFWENHDRIKKNLEDKGLL